MRIIVGCESSRRVASAFEALGHEAWSCDLKPAEQTGNHIQGNVLDHLNDGWDMGIFHPVCTTLTNSGVRWLVVDGVIVPERYAQMAKDAEFFNKLLNAPIPKVAVENPLHHKYARALIRKYDHMIQPYWFGEGETKATCLWLVNLPPLMATLVHPGRAHSIHLEPPGPNRQANRSRTFRGLAEAMAWQWGNTEATLCKGKTE